MPLIGAAGASVDADDTEVTVDRMTEEELLKGLEGLAPPEERPEPEIEVGRRGYVIAPARTLVSTARHVRAVLQASLGEASRRQACWSFFVNLHANALPSGRIPVIF